MGLNKNNVFSACTGRIYVAPPGAPAPTTTGVPSGWQPLGHMSWESDYEDSVDRLVEAFDRALKYGAVENIVLENSGNYVTFGVGTGNAIRKWLIKNYQPETVTETTEMLVRSITDHVGREDGVSTPLLDGTL